MSSGVSILNQTLYIQFFVGVLILNPAFFIQFKSVVLALKSV